MFRLDGKTALVTGASQGIGRAVAALLAKQGARVVVAARSVDKLESLAQEITAAGGQAHPLALDLSQPAEVPQRLAALPPEWAEVDVLVNNAGVTADGLFARMSLEQWERVLTTNLTGTFATSRSAQSRRKSGSETWSPS